MYRHIAIFIAACFLTISVVGQTRVAGKVVDGVSEEPIPFCNVFFLDGNEGVSTDLSGEFVLTSNSNRQAFVVSFVGYQSDTILVANASNNMIIKLESASTYIDEVEIVTPKYKDPNKELFKRVVKNKKMNDSRNIDAYECGVYNKIYVALNDINPEIKSSKLVNKVDFVMDLMNQDSSGSYLPIFISETVSEYYYKTSPRADREIINASKVSGLKNESVSMLLGSSYTDFNIYDNSINVLERDFISPLSDQGWLFYHYQIADTAYIGPYLSFRMDFTPRSAQDAAFEGYMWIDAKTYAVTKIEVTLPTSANVNLVNNMRVERSFVNYQQDGQSYWMKSSEKVQMDFKVIKKSKQPGFKVAKTTYWKSYLINQKRDNSFYNPAEDIVVSENAITQDDGFWSENRGEDLTTEEEEVYQAIDSLVNTKIFKVSDQILKMFYTGYLPFKYFEYGPYYTTYSYNSIEGKRFRIGGLTKKAFHPKLRLGGHIAYGTKDELFKYSGRAEYYFNKKKRSILSLSLLHDYRQLSDSPDAFEPDNIMASLSRRSAPRFTLLDQRKISYEKEWFKGISNVVSWSSNTFYPVGELRYFGPNNNEIEKINIQFLTFAGRLAYQEKYLEGDFDRVSLGTKKPIITYGLSFSNSKLFKSDYNYIKSFVQFRDRWYYGVLGYLDLIADASKIWGELPYPLLLQHPGNNSYYFDLFAFNMMLPGEFVSDQFVSLKMEYHLNGLFLNRIPLMKKLQWREIGYARGVMGNIVNDHESVVLFPGVMKSLEGKPYVEAGVGVENIFKCLRLDYIWRLTHNNSAGSPKSGLIGTLWFVF